MKTVNELSEIAVKLFMGDLSPGAFSNPSLLNKHIKNVLVDSMMSR